MAEKGAIGVPSGAGMKDALVDFGLGMGGGLVGALGQSLGGGSGFIANLIGAIFAGSIIKGTRGEILATMMGYFAFANLATSSPSAATTSSSRPVV